MSSNSTAKNVIALRQLLSEKFPGVRMEAGPRDTVAERWPTGVAQVDFQLEGGLLRGGITEFVSSGVGSGSSLLLAQLVEQSRRSGHWFALIDSTDSFDPGALDNDTLSRLLWVRCANAKQAMKAADLLLHDGTMSLIALDLVSCPKNQLARIPSSSWHRLSRTLEQTSTIFVALTPDPIVGTAVARVKLLPRFDLESLEADRERLLPQITAQPAAERNKTRLRRAAG